MAMVIGALCTTGIDIVTDIVVVGATSGLRKIKTADRAGGQGTNQSALAGNHSTPIDLPLDPPFRFMDPRLSGGFFVVQTTGPGNPGWLLAGCPGWPSA